MRNTLKLTLMILSFCIFSSIDVSAQCAMCKAVVETSAENGSNLAQGINNGILFLMAFPYALLIVGGFVWYRFYKKRIKPNS